MLKFKTIILHAKLEKKKLSTLFIFAIHKKYIHTAEPTYKKRLWHTAKIVDYSIGGGNVIIRGTGTERDLCFQITCLVARHFSLLLDLKTLKSAPHFSQSDQALSSALAFYDLL